MELKIGTQGNGFVVIEIRASGRVVIQRLVDGKTWTIGANKVASWLK